MACIDCVDSCDIIWENVPRLRRLASVRICYKDHEGHWVDVDERNYSKFIKTGNVINIRAVGGISPAPKPTASIPNQMTTTKRELFPQITGTGTTSTSTADRNSFVYKSPLEMDIELKQNELKAKVWFSDECNK